MAVTDQCELALCLYMSSCSDHSCRHSPLTYGHSQIRENAIMTIQNLIEFMVSLQEVLYCKFNIVTLPLFVFAARQSVPGRRILPHHSLSDRLPVQTTKGIQLPFYMLCL